MHINELHTDDTDDIEVYDDGAIQAAQRSTPNSVEVSTDFLDAVESRPNLRMQHAACAVEDKWERFKF